jgi:dTDP-4-amino-4,6-dideoxygalactose transaminase
MQLPINLFKVYMSKNAAPAVEKVLNSGYIGQGPVVEKFEKELKSYMNNDYLVTLNAGTSALHMALHLIKTQNKLSNDDEVLTSPMTCTATNFPIVANGLKIKWVDIDRKNLNIDLDDLQRKITPKTKIIMLIHWGGYPIDLDEVKKIQESAYSMYGFRPLVIEDCAHAFGSTYKNNLIGNHGNINAFSFQAIKHLTSVDGGMLILPNENLYKRAKLIRWYGIDRDANRKDFRCESDVAEWGFKFHMNDVNASVGLENLKDVNNIISKHKDNAEFYDFNLKDVPGLTLLEKKEDRSSSFWIYSMLVEKRADFMKWMKESGIVVSQVHERNDTHTAMKEFRTHLPTLDKTIRSIVSIPVGWWVTEDQRSYIVDKIKKGW